jgi:hypothetical protein
MARKNKDPTLPLDTVHPPERAEQLVLIANDALNRFSGMADKLEKALDMLMLGDYMGWKVLVVIHKKRTIRSTEGSLSW